jgi:hypothetical protein
VRRALVLSVSVVVVSAFWALASAACAASAEEQTLLKFFEAARALDRTILDKYATVGFNPRTEGIVQAFTVTDVGQERQGRKDVTIDAIIRDPAGATARRTLVVTFQKGLRTSPGQTTDDRWIITGLRQVPASRTSREASSVLPS